MAFSKKSGGTLSALQAAYQLGITPELLTAYARPSFRKGTDEPRALASVKAPGQLRFTASALDEFDRYLREPWCDEGAERPNIPAAIIVHLKAESRNQCAWCGSGTRVETAHIEAWSHSRSHHHHNLIRLCSVCHGRHDSDRTISSEDLRARKHELVAATRASLGIRMDAGGVLSASPRPARHFFGREDELSRLTEALDHGLSVQVSGPGGIGKTELLLQAMNLCANERQTIWLDIERHSTGSAILEALRIALSIDGEPCSAFDVPFRLDQCSARLVFDGIEQGTLAELDELEDAIHDIHEATRNTQIITTTQVNLAKVPADLRMVVGALGRSPSEALLCEGWDTRLFTNSPMIDILLELCEGHALTLRLAGAIASHLGSVERCIETIRKRGASGIALPARQKHDRRTSLNLCLDIAFEALTNEAQALLWLIAQAPAGLFRGQIEHDHFPIPGPVEAIADLRRWNLVSSNEPGGRERLTCLSPVRIFVSERWEPANRKRARKLKQSLFLDIALMVSIIEDRSEGSDAIPYMISRYSEEMPNIKFMVEEVLTNRYGSKTALLAADVCSSLVRYFFVLRMADEGAQTMLKAAQICLAAKRADKAASFAATLVGLARRADSETVAVAERIIADVESCCPLDDGAEGDLLMARTMLALDANDAEQAGELSREAFKRFKEAAGKVEQGRPGDPKILGEELVKARRDGLHNDRAAALRLHGDAQLAMRNFEKAAEAYRHSLRHERGASIAVNRGQTLHQIGNCEGNLGNHKSAAEHYAKALNIFLVIGMKEFISNASCELGYTLLDVDFPPVRDGAKDGLAACFEDVNWELQACLRPGAFDINRTFVLARKIFGTVAVGIFARQSGLTGDWAVATAEKMLIPFADRAVSLEEKMGCMILNIPLQLAFLVQEIETSRNVDGDPETGLVGELLAFCCAVDARSRTMFRLADWFAAYMTRELGVVGLTADRVREFMTNYDDDVHDELDLERPRPASTTD